MADYLPGIQYKTGTTIAGGGGTDPTATLTATGDVKTAPTTTTTSTPKSYTTLDSGNVTNKYLPDLQSSLSTAQSDMSPRKTYTDQSGFLRYNDDSSLVPAPKDATPLDGGGWEVGGQVYGASPSYTGDKTIDDLTAAQMQTSHRATNALIESIKQQYGALIDAQKQTNARQEAGINTALLRSGSARYSPVSAEGQSATQISYGIAQLGELTSKMNSAVSTAESALANNDFQLLGKAMGDYKELQKEKITAAKELNDKIATQALQLKQENLVADAINNGATDIQSVFKQLAGKVPIDTIKKTFDAWGQTVVDQKTLMGDLYKTAQNNGAPASVLLAISNAKKLGDAVTAAGKYGSGGSGIVGEYNYYKANGGTMSFDEYQTADANRKAKAAGNLTTGMDAKQTQNFMRITDKFQADTFINNAALKGNTATQIADQIIANPGSATNQLKALYILVKNLDPDSAVREGELTLANETQSYLQKFDNSLTRVSQGQVISPDAAKQLAVATKELVKSWDDTANKRVKQYKAQAAGAGISEPFGQYIASSDLKLSTSDDLLNKEKTAQQTLIDYGTQHPETKQHIIDLTTQTVPELGRPATYEEVLQLMGIQ